MRYWFHTMTASVLQQVAASRKKANFPPHLSPRPNGWHHGQVHLLYTVWHVWTRICSKIKAKLLQKSPRYTTPEITYIVTTYFSSTWSLKHWPSWVFFSASFLIFRKTKQNIISWWRWSKGKQRVQIKLGADWLLPCEKAGENPSHQISSQVGSDNSLHVKSGSCLQA